MTYCRTERFNRSTGTRAHYDLAPVVSSVKMSETIRGRNWCLLLYPDDPSHVECLEKLQKLGYNYCAVLHDSDIYSEDDCDAAHPVGTLKKPHYHVVLAFPNARYQIPLGKELGIKENYVSLARNLDGALLYLLHRGNPEKYQYDISTAQGALTKALERLLEQEPESGRVLRVLDVLDTLPVPVSYRAFLTRICEMDLYGDFRRMGSGIVRLLDEHNSQAWTDNRSVISKELHMENLKEVANRMDFDKRIDALERQNIPYEEL